ncbi:hypothetical protein B296_00057236, partial [Ensete ventricosum]
MLIHCGALSCVPVAVASTRMTQVVSPGGYETCLPRAACNYLNAFSNDLSRHLGYLLALHSRHCRDFSRSLPGMERERRVNPDCVNASNPFHVCAEYCVQRAHVLEPRS